MLSERQALYQSIIENPLEDTPRLVYADWLEENGESERAEFIRVQCRIESLPIGDEALPALFKKEKKLLEGRKKLWKGELPVIRGVTWDSFRRGFVARVRFTTAYRLRCHLRQVCEVTPLQSISFSARRLSLVYLGTTPLTKHVTDLDLSFKLLPADHFTDLFAGVHFDSLRSLNLSHTQLTDLSIQELAKSQAFPVLEKISLAYSFISEDAASMLTRSPWLQSQRVQIMTTGLSEKVVEILRAAFPNQIVDQVA